MLRMNPVLAHESVLDHSRIWPAVILLVLALAALSTARGVMQAPLDTHEVYVVETAQQMLDRHDWIVPYFNGQPRLRKPPLNYWLTAAAPRLTGADRVQPWHGRLPSALAGIGLVLLTVLLGARLYGRETGLLAGLMLAASNGYFDYASNARSEMVYAFLCSLGLAGFIAALQAPDRSPRQALFVYGMWLAYALATLAKGPQVPGMFLAVSFLFCAIRRIGWGRCLRVTRPFSGLLLLALLTLPWWLVLQQRLPSGAIEDSQLAGSLIFERWTREISFYYVYMPLLKLFTPWFLLAPCLLALRRSLPEQRHSALLLAIVYITLVVLHSVNNHFRVHYLLPGLMPAGLLLAAGVVASLRSMQDLRALRFARGGLALTGVAVIAALGLGLRHAITIPGGAPTEAGVALAAALCLLLVAAYLSLGRKLSPVAHVTASALLWLCLIGGLAGVIVGAKGAANHDAEIAAAILQAARPSTPLASWDENPAVLVYYTRRPIPEIRRAEEVLASLAHSPTGELVLIASPEKLALLPAGLQVKSLLPDSAGTGLTAVLLAPLSR